MSTPRGSVAPSCDWLSQVAARLQRQWPTIDAQRLEDLALDLSRDAQLRALLPEAAAEQWLAPVLAR